jgi:hypothetical protein
MHVIGDAKNPVYTCKKKEVKSLFSKDFWYVHEVWKYFHLGFGLPNGKPWGVQNPDLMECLAAMESHYQYNFSHEHYTIDCLNALIKKPSGIF